jgi:transcriptional regulator with XRE-family HTH domain
MASSEELGRTIREARLRKGMSLGQLASAVGRSSSSVRRWERGEVAPAATVLSKLEAILEIDRVDLDARKVISAGSHDAGGEMGEVRQQRTSTVEQPVVDGAAPLSAQPGPETRAAQTSDRGLISDVWSALTSGDRSWIGWLRGFLTAAVLVLMIFVLFWALSELFDALRDILDSFDVGSSGDQGS